MFALMELFHETLCK